MCLSTYKVFVSHCFLKIVFVSVYTSAKCENSSRCSGSRKVDSHVDVQKMNENKLLRRETSNDQHELHARKKVSVKERVCMQRYPTKGRHLRSNATEVKSNEG